MYQIFMINGAGAQTAHKVNPKLIRIYRKKLKFSNESIVVRCFGKMFVRRCASSYFTSMVLFVVLCYLLCLIATAK